MAVADDERERIRVIDEQLLRLAAERIRLAHAIGRRKAESGLPTVDYAQERRVLQRARAVAADEDMDPSIAEDIVERLIEAAVTAQEDTRLRLRGGGEGRTAVVVGGAGRMGGWLVRFLAAQGYAVHILDPLSGHDQDAAAAALPDADLVMVAAPPRRIARLYDGWSQDPPAGVVCDVASIKAPFVEAVARLREAGGRVASLHPMFGPGARVLRGVDVVVCDTGDAQSSAVAESLFAETAARILHVPFDEHDAWMADVLALSHATVLAFAAALPDDGLPVRSTTLGALTDLAWDVVHESPEVYYEIQAHNPYAPRSLQRLADGVQRLRDAVATHDAAAFAGAMQQGKDHLEVLRADKGVGQ